MDLHPLSIFMNTFIIYFLSHLEQNVVYQIHLNTQGILGELCKVYYDDGLGQHIIREEILLSALHRWAIKSDTVLYENELSFQ